MLMSKTRLFYNRKRIPDDIASTLDYWAGGLSSGLDLLEVVSLSATESPEYLKLGLMTLVKKVELGISWQEAISGWDASKYCPELSLLGVIIQVNNTVGTDLSNALKELAQIIRINQKIKRDLDTMTVQSRLTSLLLISVPPGLLFVANLVNPDFFRPLWLTSSGQIAGFVAIGLQLVGLIMVLRLSRVKWLA